jgi:hypothetical protein
MAFRKPPTVYSKNYFESRVWSWKLFRKPAETCTVLYFPGSRKEISDAAFEIIIRKYIERVFNQAKTLTWFVFSITRQQTNLKTVCAWTESTDLILKAFNKIFISRTRHLKKRAWALFKIFWSLDLLGVESSNHYNTSAMSTSISRAKVQLIKLHRTLITPI